MAELAAARGSNVLQLFDAGGAPSPVARIFDHWRRAVGRPRAQLDGKRARLIERRLREYDEPTLIAAIDGDTSCVVVQYPDILGRIADLTPLADACHANKALLIAVVTEPVALGAIRSPGEMDADIVVGEGQSLGVGLQFGGPYVGLFGCKDKYVRQMPGRLCGETVDADGKRGFVLTLSTREQHIRREKATSNICTNSGLCALAFSIHMTLLGEKGLRDLAGLNHALAVQAAERLAVERRGAAGARVAGGPARSPSSIDPRHPGRLPRDAAPRFPLLRPRDASARSGELPPSRVWARPPASFAASRPRRSVGLPRAAW